VSTPTHSLSILGGWWYGTEFGKTLKTLPPTIYKLASRKLLADKKAVPSLDLESIKAVGRAALGDITGSSFRMNADIPKPMAEFLMLPSSGDAIKDYKIWPTVLREIWGPPKFQKLEVTIDNVYPEGAADV
jgi:hypothetical protein